MRIRTGYSFHTAVGHLDDVMARIEAVRWDVAPITDRTSTFGFVKWDTLCKEKGKRPVFGVELAVTEKLGDKKPIVDWWTFVAKGDLAELHKLIALATSNCSKYPALTYEQALNAPNLWKMSGERCRIECCRPDSSFFIGLAPSTPVGLYREAVKRSGAQFVATSDNYYPVVEDREFYRLTLGKFRSSTQTYPQHILSDEEWLDAIWFVDNKVLTVNALANRDMVWSQSTAKLKQAELLKPEKKKTLEEMCYENASVRGVDLSDPVYNSRLKRELALIADKQFEDYFYIIADMIAFAKKHMIVGPARGSSCGSLVCYLLGITAIDPIPYDLIFERFIDVNRKDLPDIDIDFSDERRDLVFNYVRKKYGAHRVARLGTVGMFKPRSAIKQAAIGLRIPQFMVNKVTDNIIERSSGDSRALQVLEDTLKDTEAGRTVLDEYPEVLIASRMEGHPNNASQHAAGIVITEQPIIEYVAVDSRTQAAMCDKYDAERLNLLKIDALGLTQLSIFERCLQLAGKPVSCDFLEQLPLNDQKAFDVLNKGHFAGIFQFNGMSLQSLVKQVQINALEDMVSITALARPGPMASGGANEWVKRRTGRSPISYPHPLFEPHLKSTIGIVAYQEQVMQIGREIGDLSWEDVTALRKAMSKSLGKEYFDQFGDRWKKNAAAKGIPKEVLDKIWDDLCAYGAWAFNRSHAVAYGLVSYWCCWLKAHYPLEFAAATLDAELDTNRQIQLLRELAEEGIGYIPIDPEFSGARWTIAKRSKGTRLVGPLTLIDGIGPKTMAQVIDARKNGGHIKPAVMRKLKDAKTPIDTLWPIRDRVRDIFPNGLADANIINEPTPIKQVQCDTHGDQHVTIIAVAKKISPKDENEAVNVARRGGKRVSGPSSALNLFVCDDTDEIFCKINRYKYEQYGREIVERGRAGKAIYVIRGRVPPDFRMISIDRIKYLGDMQDAVNKSANGGQGGQKLKAGEQQ